MSFDRRTFLQVGGGGLLGLLLAMYGGPSIAHADVPPAKAKAIIQIWLNGGASHIDTFDPKPGVATGGPFKSIKSRAAAIELSEHLPHLADRANEIAIVRSMSSKEGNHQRAQYFLHTGYAPNPTVTHPSMGAWTSSRIGDPNADWLRQRTSTKETTSPSRATMSSSP